ncbi:MAG: S8 family serine peptidase [Thermodesulfovibrionales bacterium]|jgi:subtilisin family serine protease
MSKYILTLFLALSLISCGSESRQNISGQSTDIHSSASTLIDAPATKNMPARYVPGEVLVKFKSGTSIVVMNKLHGALGAAKIKDIRHLGIHRMKLPEDVRVEEAVQVYRNDPNVEFAEPNYIVKTSAIPNDPGYSLQWGLNNTGQTGGIAGADIHAQSAWDVTKGSNNIIIAVVDTGVAYDHPDLSGNIWVNTAELNGSPGVDDDQNGYIDDVYGWDFINNNGNPVDYDQHGTHVSGIIAAKGNNGTGISGVMWSARIMPLRFLGVTGTGDVAKAAESIEYAADNGARIINASWGGNDYSNTLYNAIDYARQKNVLVVAAAGNETMNNDIDAFYPASFSLPNIISVAATDQNDGIAEFSNFGATSVDLGAPGVSIYSSVPVFSYGDSVTIYSENFNGNSGELPLLGWSKGGVHTTWAITAGTGSGGTNCLEDSPGGNYVPGTNSWTGYMTSIPSVKNNRYRLSFKWKGNIDHNTNDFFYINYSQDGKNWDWVDYRDGFYANFVSDYTDEITSAADMLDSFYFGFGLKSDLTVNYDGVYIDDVVLSRQPIVIGSYTYESAGWSGTSMAAPFVSGVAGLIWSVNPSLGYAQVKDIILSSVDKKPSLSGKTSTGGRVNASAAVNLTMLSTPSNLSASAISKSRIDLSWQDNSSNETGFKIERKKASDASYIIIAEVGSNVTSYSDTGLSAGTKYSYRIKAYNSSGESSYSNEASATTKQASSGGGGGGCSIGGAQNYQTAMADTMVLLLPLMVILFVRRYSG